MFSDVEEIMSNILRELAPFDGSGYRRILARASGIGSDCRGIFRVPKIADENLAAPTLLGQSRRDTWREGFG